MVFCTNPHHHNTASALIGVISSRGQLEADKRASSDGLEDRSVDEKRPAPLVTACVRHEGGRPKMAAKEYECENEINPPYIPGKTCCRVLLAPTTN